MRIHRITTAFLLTISLPLAAQINPSFAPDPGPDLDSPIQIIQCGTKVDWIADNERAFAEAKRTGKPVYMLHLSGNLKNENFT